MGQGLISRSNPGNSGDKVGDIKITTRNTLGEKWALCNGEYRDDSKFDASDSEYWYMSNENAKLDEITANITHDEGTDVYLSGNTISDSDGNFYFEAVATQGLIDTSVIVKFNSKSREYETIYTSCYSYGYTKWLCKDICSGDIYIVSIDDNNSQYSTYIVHGRGANEYSISMSGNDVLEYNNRFVYKGKLIGIDNGPFSLVTLGGSNLIDNVISYAIVPYKNEFLIVTVPVGGENIFVHRYNKNNECYECVKEINFNMEIQTDSGYLHSYDLINSNNKLVVYDEKTNTIRFMTNEAKWIDYYPHHIAIDIDCSTWKASVNYLYAYDYFPTCFLNIDKCAYIICRSASNSDSYHIAPLDDYFSGQYTKLPVLGAEGVADQLHIYDYFYNYYPSDNSMKYYRIGNNNPFDSNTVELSPKRIPTISVDDESYCFIKIKD